MKAVERTRNGPLRKPPMVSPGPFQRFLAPTSRFFSARPPQRYISKLCSRKPAFRFHRSGRRTLLSWSLIVVSASPCPGAPRRARPGQVSIFWKRCLPRGRTQRLPVAGSGDLARHLDQTASRLQEFDNPIQPWKLRSKRSSGAQKIYLRNPAKFPDKLTNAARTWRFREKHVFGAESRRRRISERVGPNTSNERKPSRGEQVNREALDIRIARPFLAWRIREVATHKIILALSV